MSGDIKLKLSDSLRARVELIGSVISFDDKLDTSGLSSTKDKTLTIMQGIYITPYKLVMILCLIDPLNFVRMIRNVGDRNG